MIAFIDNIKNRIFEYLENMMDFDQLDLDQDDDILDNEMDF
jgi:hypothetical protein